jgi:hypothetical protein
MHISKVIKLLLLIAISVSTGLTSKTIAQNQDTLVVTPGFNTLNEAISSDTLVDGTRKNLNRVYKLTRGQRYILNGRITSGDWHLRIVGEQDDPSNTQPPATIWPSLRTDGSYDNRMIDVNGDLTLKNVYMLGILQNEARIADAIQSIKDSSRVMIDNCIFEGVGTHCVRIMSPGQKVYLYNNIFRNITDQLGGIFRGRVLNCNHNWQDSVVVINNTFLNQQAMSFQGRKNPVDHLIWNHNTHINMMKNVFHFENWLEAYIKNNLFINTHVSGEAMSERKGQDPDGQLMGTIFWIDTLDVAYGINENDRIIHFKNNNWFRDPQFDDYINSIDSVEIEPFLNERTVAMFGAFDNMIEMNNTNVNPQFTNPPDSKDMMIQFLEEYRSGVAPAERTVWDYQPDGDPLTLEWPLPEDLSYPNNSALYTAGDDGFPLGDLNWFPDKKADWEVWITDVPKSKSETNMATVFELAQNYPNPFNPATKISFSLKKSSHIKLTVYNIIGQKVKKLVDQEMPAGLYNVQWNGLDDNGSYMVSGIYYYRLETDSFKATRKMLLMK